MLAKVHDCHLIGSMRSCVWGMFGEGFADGSFGAIISAMQLWTRWAAVAVSVGATLCAQAPGLRIYQQLGRPTEMVDTQGNVVHSWPQVGYLTAHIAPDGTMLRARQTNSVVQVPGQTGDLERRAFDGTLLWSFSIDGPNEFAHHDIEPMPNGNLLVIAWDRKNIHAAIAQGRDPTLITGTDWLPDVILEVHPTGPTTATIVWQWRMIDHVIQDFDASKPNFGIVADHPELLDINYPPVVLADGDWNHFNGIDYDPVHDWIVVSALSQSEIYIIDHSTTTAEAAGHTGGMRGKGGDLLYRWGNPESYRAGTAANQTLAGQHDPRFIPPGYPGEGHVTLFSNAFAANQSAVFEIELPLDAADNFILDPATGFYGPAGPVWQYTDPSLFSAIMSSGERLPNGNTLIASGTQAQMLEVTPAGQVVWSYAPASSNFVFQCHYVERSLWRDADTLSMAGGQIDFDHLFGAGEAGNYYLLLGSLSGTSIGITLPGGVTLPLNFDVLTNAMVSQWNTGIYVDTFGTLDASGGGASSLVIGSGVVPAALVGWQLDFAQLLFDAVSLQPVRSGNVASVTIGL